MTSQPISELPEFGERFEVLRCLGRGGMGVVYLARDRVKDMEVALKTINNLSASMLYHFKREFRSLVDLRHRNLVAVYELLSRHETWFFTMEYLEGRDFLNHLRQSRGWFDESSLHEDAETADFAELDAAQRERLLRAAKASTEPTPAASFRLDEARPALLQLVTGLQVLHRAGHIHCDIKPSNVMVTPDGRVVILDFGLVNPVGPDILDLKTRIGLEGTYQYMAPERVVGSEASPAIDWYAVGVMLFQLLTGDLPPRDSDAASETMQWEPPSPALFPPESPGDLVALCIDLLNLEPKRRPSGDEIRRRLGDLESIRVQAPAEKPEPESAPFVGREEHRRRLGEAFTRVKEGGCLAVWVHGPSGMGKSALVHRFLRRVARSKGAVVLAGRCHEQESVPYKALDALIDALSSFLKALPRSEADTLMPRDVHTLAQLFPVLERVPAVTETPGRRFESPNRREVRRRAFGALRELLARLGDRNPLVLFIDDLQWGDVDSAAFLSELLKATDPPRVLLLGSYRSEYVDSSPALAAVLDDPGAAGSNREFIEIGPLTHPQCIELARALLGPGERTREMAELIARESQGNPFFVHELALYGRALQRDGLDLRAAEVSLENLIWQRVENLPREALLLLQAVAVSGRPLRQEDAFRAAGFSGHDERALSTLRAEHLLRTGGTALDDEVETYHDRIRETVVAHLSARALERQHRRLADALEESGRADAETLAQHFLSGGMEGRASSYFERAAHAAAKALAFDKAAALYRQALELGRMDEHEALATEIKLGEALANSGRTAEAAAVFLSAGGRQSDAERRRELRRLAAQYYLQSGHVDEGTQVLRELLAEQGISFPGSTRGALLRLMVRRAQLAVRGLGFNERAPEDQDPERLAKADVTWAAGVGLGQVHWLFGSYFQTESILFTLATGDPFRISRSLAIMAAFRAATNPQSQRVPVLLGKAKELAERLDDHYLRALHELISGVTAFLNGRYVQCSERCAQADLQLRAHCTGVAWELDTSRSYQLWSLEYLGEWLRLQQVLPAWMQEAEERGDLYAAANLDLVGGPLAELAADRPERARERIERSLSRWSSASFHLQHGFALYADAMIDLYQDDPMVAVDRFEQAWPKLQRAFILRIRHSRARLAYPRACSALAAATRVADPRPLLRLAEKEAAVLETSPVAGGPARGRAVRAGLASVRGEHDRLPALLEQAEGELRQTDLAMHAAALRRRRGELLSGDDGRRLIEEADQAMRAQGIRSPERIARLLAPFEPR